MVNIPKESNYDDEENINNKVDDLDFEDAESHSDRPEPWQEKEHKKHVVARKREIRKKISDSIKNAADIDGGEGAEEAFRKNPKKAHLVNERKTWESKNNPSKRPRDNMTMEDEVRDWGFDSVHDLKQTVESDPYWYESLDEGTETEGDFTVLYKYLGEVGKKSDEAKIERFNLETDALEKLELLRTMPLPDAIKCIHDQADCEGTYAYRYLAERLDFYQKLSQGTATRTDTQEEYDSSKGEYIDVIREEKIDSFDVTSETVRLGILRDLLYSQMIGSPELASVKIATKRLNRDRENNQKIKSVVELFGYYSGICEGSVGQWKDLCEFYEETEKHVRKKLKKELPENEIEHRVVLAVARKLENAFQHGGVLNTCASPYSPGFQESVAVGQLGDERVKAQLRGMRSKIQDTDLRNIDRFVGKCGTNKYEQERRRLYGQIKFLKETHDEDKKQEFLERENGFAIKKQNRWIEGERERLAQKRDKSIAEIEALDLSDEERGLQVQSVEDKYNRELQAAEDSYQSEVSRLEQRDVDGILADLEKRQELVETRFNKRKNLAQKALDLHWMEGVVRNEDDEDNTYNPIDWINYAPFGTIKRAHRMMRDGASPGKIIKYALAESICGKRGVNREDLAQIGKLYDSANAGSRNERRNLESMMKVGNILALSGQEVSLDDVRQMSKQRFYGMTSALREYNLEEVREFMDKELDLNSVVTVKKVTEKFGHQLNNDQIAGMASHNIDGLEDASRSFELSAVQTFLCQDVHLPTAVAVLNNTHQFGYELTIPQIAAITKNVNDVGDFTSALRSLPLEQVEQLFTIGIPYHEYLKVRSVFKKNRCNLDFQLTLAVAQKLARDNEFDNFDRAMDLYSLAEVESILDKGTTLSGVIDVREALEEKSVSTTIEETIQFSKYSGDWDKGRNVKNAIDEFGIENVREMVVQGVVLPNATNVKSEIKRQDLDHFDSIKIITAIAKHGGSVEVALKTLEAGFSIEEITRFPFLISPLVSKAV